eukprot:4501748-Ditylum_brightwellii.AAC.1
MKLISKLVNELGLKVGSMDLVMGVATSMAMVNESSMDFVRAPGSVITTTQGTLNETNQSTSTTEPNGIIDNHDNNHGNNNDDINEQNIDGSRHGEYNTVN